MSSNRRPSSRRSTVHRATGAPQAKAPAWQSMLNWFAPANGGAVSRSKKTRGASRVGLRFESLEERTVLATDINFNAGTGVLTLNVGAAETVELDVASVADFNISSDAGTTISGSAAAIGFSAEAANTISDGSLATVQRIDIVGSAGTQTINLNGGTFSALSVDAAGTIENVNFNAATTFSKVVGSAPNADLNVTAGTSLTQAAGATITTTSGGNISLSTAGNLATNAAINSTGGNGNVSLAATGNVSLGAAVSTVGTGTITIDADSDNNSVGFFANLVGGTVTTAGGDVVITAQDVDLNAAINAGAGDVELRTQTGGAISVGIDGVGLDDFGVTNADLALITAAAVRLGDAAAGNITLTAPVVIGASVPTLSLITGGTVTQNAGATLSATNLAINAAGPVTLALANDVDNLAVNVSGATNGVIFVDVDGLDIDTVDGLIGIVTVDGDVSVSATAGALNVVSAIASANGDVTLSAEDLAITAAVNAGLGLATLEQAGVALRNIDLGTETAGSLSLTDAELDLVTSSVLRIGRLDNAGSILVTSSITPALATSLSLLSGGAIVDATVGEVADITVANLALQAVAGIGSADELDVAVSTLAATTAAGNINVSDSASLTIGTVDSIVGVVNTSAAGTIDILAANALTVANNVTAQGNVDLAAGTSAAVGDNLTINAGAIVQSAADVALEAGDQVVVALGGSALAGGTLDVTGGLGEVDGGGGVTLLGAVGGSTVNLSGDAGADVFNLNPTASPATINVFGLAGNDAFTVTPKVGTVFNIDGGAPLGFPGDSLSLNLAGATGTTLLPGVPGAGQFTFTNRANVNFVGIEALPIIAGVPGTVVLVPDPLVPGQNTLVITGTSGNDRIIVDLVGSDIRVRIIQPGPDVNVRFSASTINAISIFGLAGNDRISVSSRINVAATIDGGDGNDTISGGSGNDVILGGAGNDRLFGFRGNDLLRGGDGNDALYGGLDNDVLLGEAGNDRLYGQSGFDLMIGGLGVDYEVGSGNENILIGGTTVHDNNDAALLAIVAQFSGSGSFQQRTDALVPTLNAGTVVADSDIDRLIGGGGSDWFLDFALQDKTNFRASRDRLNV